LEDIGDDLGAAPAIAPTAGRGSLRSLLKLGPLAERIGEVWPMVTRRRPNGWCPLCQRSRGSLSRRDSRRPTCGAPHWPRERYGDDAMFEAAAPSRPAVGDWRLGQAGPATWHRILNAIERLQAKVPAKGEAVH